jgi:hypothetical protein
MEQEEVDRSKKVHILLNIGGHTFSVECNSQWER